eukprot:3203721-Rhodomonas_salina.1
MSAAAEQRPGPECGEGSRACTGRNQVQETAISGQPVPGMRFLLPDFGVYLVLEHRTRSQEDVAEVVASYPLHLHPRDPPQHVTHLSASLPVPPYHPRPHVP